MGYRYLDSLASEENIRSFLELADLAAGAATSANNVFELQQRLRRSKPMQLCEKRLASDPASAALIAARHISPPYDAAALRVLPRGTLGRSFVTVLDVQGYDINFFPQPSFYNDLASDADYINYRVSATHDLHHILTGFNPEKGGGELGVLSFGLAQTSHPAVAFLDLIALMLHWLGGDTPITELDDPLEQSTTAAHTYRMITLGLEMGAAAKPLFPVLWEERLEQDLEDLRRELGIKPVREGLWNWEANPRIQAALAA